MDPGYLFKLLVLLPDQETQVVLCSKIEGVRCIATHNDRTIHRQVGQFLSRYNGQAIFLAYEQGSILVPEESFVGNIRVG